jgi:hypothetical protein
MDPIVTQRLQRNQGIKNLPQYMGEDGGLYLAKELIGK